MAPLLHGLPASQEASEDSYRGGEGRTTLVYLPHTALLDLLEEDSVKTLLHSVMVLDGWLEKNEGHIEDEVRLRRIRHWREEALEQLRLHLNLARL
jgi:hypothetical protein